MSFIVLYIQRLVAKFSFVERNLQDLDEAFYKEDSESTYRIAIDIILIQCQIFMRRKYQSYSSSHPSFTCPATPHTQLTKTPILPFGIPDKPLIIFPEAVMSVEIENRSGRFLFSGRADWALGYRSTGNEGALLSAIGEKQQAEFGKGENQLLAYLAIIRENRKRVKKIDSVTQGFYSDGFRFGFIHITEAGTIMKSSIFDIASKEGRQMVFRFIVSMIETALKSTPITTPTKPGQQQDREVNSLHDEIWSKVYASTEESVLVPSDCDSDYAIDVST